MQQMFLPNYLICFIIIRYKRLVSASYYASEFQNLPNSTRKYKTYQTCFDLYKFLKMRRQLLIVFLGAVLIAESALGGRKIQFNNQCGKDIWVSPSTNANQGPTLDIAKIGNGGSYTYNIPDSGWGGRFWPKLDCDGSGQNCAVGQSVPPCPSGGCQPPADTKVEFYFPQVGGNSVWYDISLVDGYSLPAQIVPSNQVSIKQSQVLFI